VTSCNKTLRAGRGLLALSGGNADRAPAQSEDSPAHIPITSGRRQSVRYGRAIHACLDTLGSESRSSRSAIDVTSATPLKARPTWWKENTTHRWLVPPLTSARGLTSHFRQGICGSTTGSREWANGGCGMRAANLRITLMAGISALPLLRTWTIRGVVASMVCRPYVQSTMLPTRLHKD